MLPEGSIDMHVSIDKSSGCTPWNNINSLDSTNPVTSDDISDNPVIELSHFIDDLQLIFAKAKSLLMEHMLIIQTLGKLWNRSKESLMQRPKKKQVRVSPKVPPNNLECVDVYQCLSAMSIQSIENIDNKRTINKDMRF
jgi:hypothetical protein